MKITSLYPLILMMPLAVSTAWAQKQRDPELQKIIQMRDPFKQLPGIFTVEEEEPPTELESYSLGQLKLKGVVTGPDRLKAMIVVPGGETFFVGINEKIGTRKGRVYQIKSDRVIVIEKIRNLLGEEESVLSEIQMQLGNVISGGTNLPEPPSLESYAEATKNSPPPPPPPAPKATQTTNEKTPEKEVPKKK